MTVKDWLSLHRAIAPLQSRRGDGGRRIVGRVGMLKIFGPEPTAPCDREFFGTSLTIETQSLARPAGTIGRLQVSNLMQEDLVEHESPDGDCRPLGSPLRTEFRGGKCVPSAERAEAQPLRQRAQRNFTASAGDIAEPPDPETAVIEVHGSQSLPKFVRQPAQHDANIRSIDEVDAIRRAR